MIKQLFAAAALAGIAATSCAADTGASAAPASSPFYVGIDGGATKPEFSGTHGSYGAFAGYNFAPNFAVETGFRRLFDTDGWGMQEHANQTSLSVVGTMPLTPSLGVYGRVGVNRLSEHGHVAFMVGDTLHEASYSESETHPLLGVGLSYKLTSQVSARIEAQRLMSGTRNYSAGLSYGF